MSSSGGCARYSDCLAGVDHSHVQRRILASHLVWKQRISCAAVLPRDEESDLPHRPKISCHCSVMEVVPQVVAFLVTKAGGARPVMVVESEIPDDTWPP